MSTRQTHDRARGPHQPGTLVASLRRHECDIRALHAGRVARGSRSAPPPRRGTATRPQPPAGARRARSPTGLPHAPRQSGARSERASWPQRRAGIDRVRLPHWPHDLAVEQRHGKPVDTGDQLGDHVVPSYVDAEPRRLRGALCLPRHRHGAALLNDERPATRGANGSQAFLGERLRSGEVRLSPQGRRLGRAKFSERLMGGHLTPSSRGYAAADSRAPTPRLGGLMRSRLLTDRCSRRPRTGRDGQRHPHRSQEQTGKATRRPTAPTADHMNQGRITVLAPPRTGPRHTATLASTSYQTRSIGLRPRRQQRDGPAPQTTNERQGRSGYGRSQTSSAHHTPLHKRGSSRCSEGAFVLSKRTSGYVCRLGPRLERGGRRTTASHQSRHRKLPLAADTSSQNPHERGGFHRFRSAA